MEIRVQRGRPTPEELAAVVALVQARAVAAEAEPDEPPAGQQDGWSSPARNLPPAMPRPAPTAWRMSGRPGGLARVRVLRRPAAPGSTLVDMLWRDDQGDDKPPEEMRQAQLMLRRAMVVAAVVAWVLMAFTNWPF